MDSLKVNVLIKALESGSMTSASEELGYSTSGISQMITSIENELGFQIVTRGRGGIALTKAGEEVYPALLSYSRADESIRQIASEVNGLRTGHVTIGAFSSISANWLPDIIREFRKDYPGIKVSIYEGIHDEIEQMFRSTQMDFCMYSYTPENDAQWIPLYDDPMYAVVSACHPFAQRTEIDPAELNGQPFIMPGRGKDRDVLSLLSRFDIHPDIQYYTMENYSALSMVEAGLGVSVMNELITERRINKVVMVPFDPPQHITMGIYIRDMKEASPAAKKIIEYIRSYVTQLG